MPSYSLRQHNNGTFYVHWTEGRRSKRQSTGTKEAAAAQTFLAHWILGERRDREEGQFDFAVADLWGQYFSRHVEKNNMTSDGPAGAWKNLEPHFGALRLDGFDVKDEHGDDKVEQYVKLRTAGKIGKRPAAPGTIRYELSILRACFSWCAKPKQKIIKQADVPVFDLPPDSEARDRWLSADEMHRMVAAAVNLRDDGLLSSGERFLWLALETASRLTAILELTWDRVDFETKVIHYNVPGRRKTRKRRASVPISSTLLPMLLRAKKESTSDFVVDSSVSKIEHAVKKIAKLAGVEDVSPHVLRHTAATHMLRRGVSIWTVAGVLGDTVETVQKVYGHHCPETLAAGVELISGGLLEPAE